MIISTLIHTTVIIGVVLLLIGVFPVIDYFRYRKEGLGASVGLISGIFSIVCGLMLLINEDLLMILIPVFIGVWMIINGINKIKIIIMESKDIVNFEILESVFLLITSLMFWCVLQ